MNFPTAPSTYLAKTQLPIFISSLRSVFDFYLKAETWGYSVRIYDDTAQVRAVADAAQSPTLDSLPSLAPSP